MRERMKELRIELKKSQASFGEALGLTKSSISRIESGSHSLTDRTITTICREFNVNETWLRTGEGEMFIKTQADDLAEIASRYHLDDMDHRMLTAYLELPADARAVIKDYIHSVASTPLDATSTDDRAALHRALDAELDSEKVGQMSEAFTDGNLKEKSS